MNISTLVSMFPQILAGLPLTLKISCAGMGLSIAIAVVFMVIYSFKIKVFNLIIDLFLLVSRSTPFIIQLFVLYYGIPAIIKTIQITNGKEPDVTFLSSFALVIIAFGFGFSANVFYNLKSALIAVDKRQYEAAKSVGMTNMQAYKMVILPQAATAAIRPVGNTFIILLKATAFGFLVSMEEMMGMAKIAGGLGLDLLEAFFGAALVYWAVVSIINKGIDLLDNRARRYQKGAV